ncbi:MAG: ABC transporter permease [Deltaproteobacteria bacterium]|jgi:peptide/nickel transport system permease protein/nickel transport system permease protein|nr:ABC transporter permease [Deltaproteobacteria bacterium]
MSGAFLRAATSPRIRIHLITALALVLLAIFAERLAPNDIYKTDYTMILKPPSAKFIMGTDYMGRCVFSRILCGTATTLKMTFSAVAIIFAFGTVVGVLAGWLGGTTDTLVMRLADIMLAFPGLILAIAIAGIMGGGLQNAILAIAAVTWPRYARLSRSLVMKERGSVYVDAARAAGTGQLAILVRHILPNVLSLMILSAVMDIGVVTMELAGLSYLGLGAQPPAPEWGLMLAGGKTYFQTAPWLLLAPALAIFIVIVIFNLLGDRLRDILDPRDLGTIAGERGLDS